MQVFKRVSVNCAANSGSLSHSHRAQTLYDAVVNCILDFIYIKIDFTWHILSLHTLQPTHTVTLPISCPAKWDFLNKLKKQIFIISYSQVVLFCRIYLSVQQTPAQPLQSYLKESQANQSFSNPTNKQNSTKSHWPFPCLIFLHALKQSMELDFGVNFTFEPGSFLPPSAISTLKSKLLPWMASASSVIVDTDFLVLWFCSWFSSHFPTDNLDNGHCIYPAHLLSEWWHLIPRDLTCGRYPTGSPSRVRLSLPLHCHAREQHFCRKSSYSKEFRHAGLQPEEHQFSLHLGDVCMRLNYYIIFLHP